ncbi:hypothetical protein JOB18_022771 [Solea senegalensis]|uniref:Uncharacterized protein n=1 Tax=Solea senegalensis TaxID=28829 RepID=A0AAV6SGN1_SOLSE|nr:hypothetical protein JOB18_022771 [Solea senegalensis]
MEESQKRGRAQTQAERTHPLLNLQSGLGVLEGSMCGYALCGAQVEAKATTTATRLKMRGDTAMMKGRL